MNEYQVSLKNMGHDVEVTVRGRNKAAAALALKRRYEAFDGFSTDALVNAMRRV